jgi:hypothetical protein
MSDSWHRSRCASHARSHGDFGFYDTAYQIVLLPQEAVAPHVVVDHEITHVNLVQNSSIGALERMLVWLEWTAQLNDNAETLATVQALSRVILSATEVVHEAAAWFGTELQSEGHENIKAPAAYARDLKRLRRVFDRMLDNPFPLPPEGFSLVLEVSDSIAMYSLSPPCMRTVWLQPEQVSVESLGAALERKEENPLRRFRQLCSRLEAVSFSAAVEWAHAVDIEGRGVRSDAEKLQRMVPVAQRRVWHFGRQREIPASFRSELYELGTAKVLHALVARTGLFNAAPVRLYADGPPLREPDAAAVFDAFASFEVTHGFVPELDRYSQVCVLETSSPSREIVYDTPDLASAALSCDPYLIVSVTRAASAATFTRAPEHLTQVIITGPSRGTDADGRSLRPTWYADIDSVTHFLKAYGQHQPILASSVGYDFGAGDYTGVTLLADIPHVVVTIRDFRSLWLALGRNGVRGSRIVEWMPMPSPSGREYFGFMVLKAADSYFPIVVNPSLVSQRTRSVSVADRWPAASGVRLVERQGDPVEWLGPMRDAVMTAAAVFEMGAQPNAVFTSALLYQRRANAGRDPVEVLLEQLQRGKSTGGKNEPETS